jgi:hypothetical protein
VFSDFAAAIKGPEQDAGMDLIAFVMRKEQRSAVGPQRRRAWERNPGEPGPLISRHRT